MTMPLSEALTRKIIAPAILPWYDDIHPVFVCSTCGAYLVYESGQYKFTCKCFEV